MPEADRQRLAELFGLLLGVGLELPEPYVSTVMSTALPGNRGGEMELERGLVKTSAGYLHYRATGQGQPIILMHTNQRLSALYLELMAVLGQGLRVVALIIPAMACRIIWPSSRA